MSIYWSIHTVSGIVYTFSVEGFVYRPQLPTAAAVFLSSKKISSLNWFNQNTKPYNLLFFWWEFHRRESKNTRFHQYMHEWLSSIGRLYYSLLYYRPTKAAIENLQLSFNLTQDTLSDLRLVLNSEKSSFMFFSKVWNVAFIKSHILSVGDCLTERVTDK